MKSRTISTSTDSPSHSIITSSKNSAIILHTFWSEQRYDCQQWRCYCALKLTINRVMVYQNWLQNVLLYFKLLTIKVYNYWLRSLLLLFIIMKELILKFVKILYRIMIEIFAFVIHCNYNEFICSHSYIYISKRKYLIYKVNFQTYRS